jgi:hypothetical protein
MVKDVLDCAGAVLADCASAVLADAAGCADEHPATAMTAASTAVVRIRMVVPLFNR